MSSFIDISVPLYTGMAHWPGDTEPIIKRTADMANGDVYNLSSIQLSAHAGTHIDAPLHFIRDGRSVDELRFDTLVGECRVIEIAGVNAISRRDLEPHSPAKGERILIKTDNSSKCWGTDEFQKTFAHLSAEAARYLVDCGIRTVGVDYLSIGAFEGDGTETHQILLGAGVWAIEGLNLSAVAAGRYELICLPLKLAGTEGAPARAVLRSLE